MAEKNVTTEVTNMLIDSMPEPSPMAEQMVAESEAVSVSESESVSPPTPTPKTGANSPPVPPVEWVTANVEKTETSGRDGTSGGDTASESPKGASSGTGLFDSVGAEFNPNFHAKDSSGNPSKTKSGKWRRRKGVVSPAPTVDANAVLAAALAIVSSIELLGNALGGDEWKPEQSEHEMMVNAWRDYFYATGAVTIPPWMGVVIATGAYAMPRLQKPVTTSRLVKIYEWCKRGVSWMF